MPTTPIPAVVHWIWLGPPIPDTYLAQTTRFAELNPHIHHEWWNENRIDNELHLTNRHWYDHAPDIVPADSVHQMRSDIARYEILHQHGGIYLDCDYQWQKPLTPHLAGHRLVSAWEQQYRYVANGFIASAPGHIALTQAINAIPTRIADRHPLWRANRITGPHLWTPIAKQHAHLLHQRLLHPVPWTHPEWVTQRTYPDAIAVHAWNHQTTLKTETP